MPSILLLGATGYIGGSVLVSIKSSFAGYNILALVRNPAHNEAVIAAGASSIINPSNASDLLTTVESHSAEVDIVINCANADDAPLTEAILRGLKSKFVETKKKGILIHTSGVGVFLDGRTDGKFDGNGKMYTDETEDDIKGILDRPQAWHANCDIPILKAGEEGYVDTYIVAPGGIYGKGTGPVGVVGGVTALVKGMKDAGHVFYIGDGSSVFGAIHIADLATLYILVLQRAILNSSTSTSSSPPASPFARYYIASVENIPWKWSAAIFGEVMHKHGLIKDAVPESKKAEETGFLGFIFGGNSTTRAVRAMRELGWKPRGISKEMYVDTLEEAIKTMEF